MRYLKIILLSMFILPSASFSLDRMPVGECRYIINFDDSKIYENTLKANIQISISLPSGDGFVFIPLPFLCNGETKFIVGPNSSYNSILYGYFRPENNCGVCQINLSDTNSSFDLIFNNISLFCGKVSYDEPLSAFQLLIARNISKIINQYPRADLPNIANITIHGLNINRSIPDGHRTSNRNEFQIELDEKICDVTIEFEKQLNQYVLVAILGIMGALLGYFATPKIVNSKRWSIVLLIISIISIMIFAFIFINIFDPIHRLKDTTTIVTSGMVCGLFFGFIVGSVQRLTLAPNTEG